MLQNLFQSLMGGQLPPGFEPAAAAGGGAAAAAAGRQAGGGSSGFRVTRLPGGGFSATYSSSSGPGSSSAVHMHTSSTTHGGGGGFDQPPFAGPDDFLSQLLLAGARSARDTTGAAAQPGFTHYDPRSGSSHFEPVMGGGGPGGGGPGAGLEALLNAIMGPGFGEGGMGTYEDFVGLDNVRVTTPEEVLSSLPHSKFVEGRMPGDRWVFCLLRRWWWCWAAEGGSGACFGLN